MVAGVLAAVPAAVCCDVCARWHCVCSSVSAPGKCGHTSSDLPLPINETFVRHALQHAVLHVAVHSVLIVAATVSQSCSLSWQPSTEHLSVKSAADHAVLPLLAVLAAAYSQALLELKLARLHLLQETKGHG